MLFTLHWSLELGSCHSDAVQTCMSGNCIDFGQINKLQMLLNKQGPFYSQQKRLMQVSNKQALPS